MGSDCISCDCTVYIFFVSYSTYWKILTHLKCFRRYTKWYLNVLEIAFLLNLILLGYVATAFASEQQQHLIYTSLLLIISSLLFFGIILYHIHLKVKPKFDVRKYFRKYKIMSRAKVFSKNASTADESFVLVHSNSSRLQGNDQCRETLLDRSFLEFIANFTMSFPLEHTCSLLQLCSWYCTVS